MLQSSRTNRAFPAQFLLGVWCLTLVVFRLEAAPVAAQAGTVFDSNEHFTIELPPHWTVLPKVQVERQKELTRLLMPNLRVNEDFVFQAENASPYSFPYITVNVKKVGRLPAASAEELISEMNKDLPGAVPEAEKATKGLLSNTQTGSTDYDPTTGILWFKARTSVANFGSVSALIGIHFYSKGYIQFNGYAPSSDFAAYHDTFKRIIESVRIDPNYKYNPIGASKLASFFYDMPLKAKVGLVLFVIALLGKLSSFRFSSRRNSAGKPHRSLTHRLPYERASSNGSSEIEYTPHPRSPVPTNGNEFNRLPGDPDKALVASLQQILDRCSFITSAYLFTAKDAELGPRITLGITFQDESPLKAQQESLRAVRQELASGPDTWKNTRVIPLTPTKLSEAKVVGRTVFSR